VSATKECLENLTRENAPSFIVRRIQKSRSIAQANIELLEICQNRFILKDFHGHHPFIKRIWGSRIIAREARVYKRLEGIGGIPRVLKILDQFAFVMEYVEGEMLSKVEKGSLPPDFFARLKTLINDMHGRGITHGDIREKNIIVAPGYKPFLIDFAGAFCLKGGGNFLNRALLRRLIRVDNLTILKIQNNLLPESLAPEELRQLQSIPWYLKTGRFLKKKIYRPFKHFVRKERRWKGFKGE